MGRTAALRMVRGGRSHSSSGMARCQQSDAAGLWLGQGPGRPLVRGQGGAGSQGLGAVAIYNQSRNIQILEQPTRIAYRHGPTGHQLRQGSIQREGSLSSLSLEH